LHVGAADVTPLTTLIDAAWLLGNDMDRLVDAQCEVERPLGTQPRAQLAMLTPADGTWHDEHVPAGARSPTPR